MIVGTEWLVEAVGCDAGRLRDPSILHSVIDEIIADLSLTTLGSVWHTFAGEGGVTGLVALTESHLACHTYPEFGIATFNLYCCRSRPEWEWELKLSHALGAAEVQVRRIQRGSDQVASIGHTNGRRLDRELTNGGIA
jgi:S-adenosylmethionine decarboxylase